MEKARRAKVLIGATRKIATGCGNMYVTLNVDKGKPFEVFGILGKAGACAKCQCEAITRCITMGLRYGVPIEEYVKMLENISCPQPTHQDGERISSCPDAIAKAIRDFEKEREQKCTIT